jgi:hypothetical protein
MGKLKRLIRNGLRLNKDISFSLTSADILNRLGQNPDLIKEIKRFMFLTSIISQRVSLSLVAINKKYDPFKIIKPLNRNINQINRIIVSSFSPPSTISSLSETSSETSSSQTLDDILIAVSVILIIILLLCLAYYFYRGETVVESGAIPGTFLTRTKEEAELNSAQLKQFMQENQAKIQEVINDAVTKLGS